MPEKIFRGRIVRHDNYGRVRVTDLKQRVDAIGVDGEAETVYLVEFTTEHDKEQVLNHTIKQEPMDKFLENL